MDEKRNQKYLNFIQQTLRASRLDSLFAYRDRLRGNKVQNLEEAIT